MIVGSHRDLHNVFQPLPLGSTRVQRRRRSRSCVRWIGVDVYHDDLPSIETFSRSAISSVEYKESTIIVDIYHAKPSQPKLAQQIESILKLKPCSSTQPYSC